MRGHRLHAAPVLPLVALLVTACAEAPTGPETQPPAAVMLGEWTYRNQVVSADPPSLNGGLFVAIVIDSANGMTFRGRVALWFAGDVGMPPGTFGAVTGQFDELDAVTVRIPLSNPDASAITIRGTVAENVLTVRECRFGSAPGPFPVGAHFHRVTLAG
ncbi:MAG: hypothetical protein WD773_03670 [Gemmatimonadales bacterium]